MIAYVARDKDGALYFHKRKPYLDKSLEEYFSEDFFSIEEEMFPELSTLTYEDSPIEVEFNIKRV